MAVGVALVAIGLIIYLGTPAIVVNRRDPNPTPGGHDAPAWVTTVALAGGVVALVGIMVVALTKLGIL